MLLAVCILAGAPVLAQDGFQLVPALTVAEIYDDGFAPPSAGPAQALVLRLSPQLSADYLSARLAILSRAAFDADLFEARPERTAAWARRTGELQIRALATQLLTLSAGAIWRETNNPRDLYAASGFDPGLVQVQSLELNGSAAYRLTPLAKTFVAYGFTRTAIGRLATDSQSIDPAIEEELSPRDKGRLDVLVRRLSFPGHLVQVAAVPMIGWAHDLTPHLSFSLQGGPRLAGRALDGAEASASLRAESYPVHALLSCATTQTAVAGLVGAVSTQSVSAAVTYEFSDRLALSAAPSAFASRGAPLEAKSFQLEMGATWRVSDWLALLATYRYGAQQVSYLSPGPFAGGTNHRQLLFLSASFTLASPRTSRSIE